MNLDFSRCRLPLFQHQREDIATLMQNPWFFITSEMRTGKSAIVVVAAQFLFEAGEIDKVIIIAPAPVRDVWADQTLGEVAKHSFVPTKVTEFHARIKTWAQGEGKALEWYVTNFEFIRSKKRIEQLAAAAGHKTLLVLDESSFVKSHSAQQTKSCVQLRKKCGRVVLLNGTPIFHSPMDLFSQGNLLHPSVLDCKYITLFKARYAMQEPVLGRGGRPLTDPRGKAIQKVTGWTNLEDLQRRFAPVTVRRLQRDCLDLPPKLDPVVLTATLTPETWRVYKEMKNELVVWLSSGNVVTAATAAIKALRLSQITSGFLGGVEDAGLDLEFEGPFDDDQAGRSAADTRGEGVAWASIIKAAEEPALCDLLDDDTDGGAHDEGSRGARTAAVEVGREKLDVLLWFLGQRLEADPNLKVVAWCLFRAELFRMIKAVSKAFPQFEVASVHGGQKKADRIRALSLLKPETSPAMPVFVGGTYGTGSFGLDMTAAHTSINVSSGYSAGRHAQSADRLYGPGQREPVAYFDIVAVGPRGQRTIDHTIVSARREGESIASWTSAAWVKALAEE